MRTETWWVNVPGEGPPPSCQAVPVSARNGHSCTCCAATDGIAARQYGSGWESNPPGPPLQHPSDGFEDRGAHRDSTTPRYGHRILGFSGLVKKETHHEGTKTEG
jgi:hypothetical protein